MKYLLDTHVWLWLIGQPDRVDDAVRDQLRTAETLSLSAASVWEIGIKHALGKLPLPATPERFVTEHMRRSGVESLPILASHAITAASLPPHHNDPFDRMIIAQANMESLTLVSVDSAFARYDVTLLRPN